MSRSGRTRRLFAAGALAALTLPALGGCGSDGAAGGDAMMSDSDAPSGGATKTGAGSKALAPDSTKPVTVKGFLVAKDGTVRLCEGLAESMPPGCSGASLEVRGADLGAYQLQHSGSSSWSTAPVSMTGTVAAGVLTPKS